MRCADCRWHEVSGCLVERRHGDSFGWPDPVDCPHYQKFWHAGGCGWCIHLRGSRCHDPALGVPLDYHEARERGRPCGPRAEHWELYDPERLA